MNKATSTGSSSSTYSTRLILSLVCLFVVLQVHDLARLDPGFFIRRCDNEDPPTSVSVPSTTNPQSSSSKQAFFSRIGSIDHEIVPHLDKQGLDMDTSIIIPSSLIPTHPNITMINQTLHSLKHLRGLSPKAPIFITIDFPKNSPTNQTLERLDQYIQNLKDLVQHQTNIHIIQSMAHRHLSGNLRLAIDRVHTKFVYLVQHDFPFLKDIDHNNLRKSLEEYPQYLRNVRFEKNNRIWGPVCHEWIKRLNISDTTPADHVNGLNFTLFQKWSDQNQFALRSYYDEQLTRIGTSPRFPEQPQQYAADTVSCAMFGQHVYGNYGEEGKYILHLDGQRTQK